MDTSMNLSLFTAKVIRSLQEKLGENFKVFSSMVRKNNGVELVGIVAKEKGSNASPTIYINDFFEEYKRGVPVERIVESLQEIFLQNQYAKAVDLSEFANYECAKKQIVFKVINYEKNWELLKEIPHKVFCNLAIVFYYTVTQFPFEGRASILIYNSHLENWKITEDELYKQAMKNTPMLLPAQIENIEEVMVGLLKNGLKKEKKQEEKITVEIFGKNWVEELLCQLQTELETEKDRLPMYVLSNQNKLLGAACMLYPDVLKRFAEEKQKNLFILPSSIHEVILLPETENMNQTALLDMVMEINRTQVEECEVLADSVYYFDRITNKLERLG